MKKIILGLTILIAHLFGGYDEDVASAINNKDFKRLEQIWIKGANEGIVSYQTNLGIMYSQGAVVKQNYKKAVKWYTKAAEQGDKNAQYNLALKYHNGQGVKKNYKKAVKWYKKAAEQGDKNAQWNLDILCGQNPWACK